MKETFHCLIKILSPVHIGCGEVYEPMSFVVDEAQKQLVVFDPFQFIASLPPIEKEKLKTICERGDIASILELYKFFRNKPAKGSRVDLCSGFLDHYKKILSITPVELKRNQKELNKFAIDRTAFLSGAETPFLPGSSVKGSLRTALLNLRQQNTPVKLDQREQNDRNASVKLENKLLNYREINEDPFRLVKVSDFMPAGIIRRKVIYAVDKKKKPSDESGLYQIMETIMPGSLFWGTISVEDAIGSGIKKPIKMKEIKEGARMFYASEKTRENLELSNAGCTSHNSGDPDAIPLRLGRHSGAESVTIKGHRSIRIMKLNIKLDHATTFWLASENKSGQPSINLTPFGWAEMIEIPESEYEKYRDEPITWPEEVTTTGAVFSADVPDTVCVQAPTVIAIGQHWPTASLTWSPGNNTLTAVFEGKKAIVKGKELVPEALHKKLFEQKKSVNAGVEVEATGNRYLIVNIK